MGSVKRKRKWKGMQMKTFSPRFHENMKIQENILLIAQYLIKNIDKK